MSDEQTQTSTPGAGPSGRPQAPGLTNDVTPHTSRGEYESPTTGPSAIVSPGGGGTRDKRPREPSEDDQDETLDEDELTQTPLCVYGHPSSNRQARRRKSRSSRSISRVNSDA
jgi:hypothetical protein